MSLRNNIAHYLLSQKEVPKANKQFVNWKQLSSVLILAYENQLSDVVDFINSCKKDNIYVLVAFVYDGKPEQMPNPHFAHVILDKKQFNFFYLPKTEAIQKLNATLFDVVINLGDAQQLKTLAISQLISAKCKISRFENPVFDMTIDSEKALTISNYLQQVIVYLNMIKTNP